MGVFNASFVRVSSGKDAGNVYFPFLVEVFALEESARLGIGAPPSMWKSPMDTRELESIRDAITEALKEEREEEFVQVKFKGSSRLYTYREPTGQIVPGDWVIVPTYHGEFEEIAQVKSRGRGTYKGAVVSAVKSRLTEERL